MNSVNDVLKAVMHDHKLSQADIARLFDVRRGTWDIDEVIKILDSVGCRLVIESGSIKRYYF